MNELVVPKATFTTTALAFTPPLSPTSRNTSPLLHKRPNASVLHSDNIPQLPENLDNATSQPNANSNVRRSLRTKLNVVTKEEIDSDFEEEEVYIAKRRKRNRITPDATPDVSPMSSSKQGVDKFIPKRDRFGHVVPTSRLNEYDRNHVFVGTKVRIVKGRYARNGSLSGVITAVGSR